MTQFGRLSSGPRKRWRFWLGYCHVRVLVTSYDGIKANKRMLFTSAPDILSVAAAFDLKNIKEQMSLATMPCRTKWKIGLVSVLF